MHSGSTDGYVDLWDAAALKEIFSYDTNSGIPRKCPVQAIDVSQDGSMLGIYPWLLD